MSKHTNNVQRLKRLTKRLPYGDAPFEASTGRYNTDGTLNANAAVGLNAGEVWVRREGDRSETRALNTLVRTDITNIPVRVAQDAITGELTVVGIRDSEAITRFGNYATSLQAQPLGEVFRTTVNSRNLKPGRVRVWISGTLNVNAEAFWYNDTTRARVLWEPSDTNVLDLSGNVPAAVGGINQQRWVVIALNPNATTPALVAFNGTAQSIALPLLITGIESISVTAGYTRLAAVLLQTGDSDESNLIDTDFEDLRPWVVGVNYSAITGAAITNSTIDGTVIGATTRAAISGASLTLYPVSNTPFQMAADISLQSLMTVYATTGVVSSPFGSMVFQRAAGSGASPSVVVANDVLGSVNFRGWQSAQFANGSVIQAQSTETWSSTARGSRLNFFTTPDGTTSIAIGMTLHQDKRLEVLGALSAAGIATVNVNDNTTNAVTNVMVLAHNTSGTPATGIGTGVLFASETSTTPSTTIATIQALWPTVTHASRKGRVVFNVYDTTAREAIAIEASGTAPMIGFLGAAAVARPAAYTQTYATATRTRNAYTADNESAAYTGIDNAQAGTVYATVADLNALRIAYENLRALSENNAQISNQEIDDLQLLGLFA